MSAWRLLTRIAEAYRAVLRERLVGFYVHGSLAFGCFSWETGDLDFIAVTASPLAQHEKEDLIRLLLDLTPEAPSKGFEMSVVLAQHCAPFAYPTPFELHYSNAHKAHAEADLAAYCRDMHGTDPDLAAHFTVLRHVGIPLYGPPIGEIFAPVPRDCYVDSILLDVNDAAEAIAANPVCCILNLCRVLAYLREERVLSKEQGGLWGLEQLPERYHPLLHAALSAYRTGAAFMETELLTEFSAGLLGCIHALSEK